MPNREKIDPNVAQVLFSRPIPGQSWASHAPRQTPWQNPPHFVKLDEAMHYLFDKLTDGRHMRDLLNLMHGGMAIEAIARTILFTGFTQGEWTPSLMMLMYKPLLLLLMAIAKKAGIEDAPVVHPEPFKRYHDNQQGQHMVYQEARRKMERRKPPQTPQELPAMSQGFMNKGGC